jgi:CCR4-NOT transcription complex subunit 2
MSKVTRFISNAYLKSRPLYPTFAGPFAGGPARPMQPDFTLPPCYTVHNTHKLEEKVPSFSDETLFYMFYTMPRDVMQEVAAVELYVRPSRFTIPPNKP